MPTPATGHIKLRVIECLSLKSIYRGGVAFSSEAKLHFEYYCAKLFHTYPPKHPIRHSIFPHQASCHTSVAFPVPPCVHIALKGLKETLFGINLIDKANMAYAPQSFIEYREHIRFSHRPTNSLVGLSPRHSHSVCPLVRNAALLPKVYHRV